MSLGCDSARRKMDNHWWSCLLLVVCGGVCTSKTRMLLSSYMTMWFCGSAATASNESGHGQQPEEDLSCARAPASANRANNPMTLMALVTLEALLAKNKLRALIFFLRPRPTLCGL